MRGLITVVLALGMSLAGCFGGTDGNDVDGDDMEQAPLDSDAGNGTNSPPVVEFAANRTDGPAPLDVRFDFNASDPDGGNLTWTLDVDGDGTVDSEGAVLPFNFTFTFSTPGTFNATLNVTDGTNATVGVVTITASEAAADEEGGDQEPFQPIEETAMVVVPCVHCTEAGDPSPSAGWTAGVQGIETVWVELPESAAGQPFEVTSDGAPLGDPDVVFMDACDSGASAVEGHFSAGAESGEVPSGAGCLVAWEWVGNPGTSITITVG